MVAWETSTVNSYEVIQYLSHPHPVWRDRANYIVHVIVESGGGTREQIWTRVLDDGSHEVCCIPAFAYNLALGDIVEVSRNNIITRVLRASGWKVFRAFFPSQDLTIQLRFVEHAQSLGAIVEPNSGKLIAVACESAECAGNVMKWLTETEAPADMKFERGDQDCRGFYFP